MATGKVTPVIDRRYRLSEARDAFLYMDEGHACGKVVITPEDQRRVSDGTAHENAK
jgi:NADPH:quinone reductase-like Zn-dependent oxidoreductase